MDERYGLHVDGHSVDADAGATLPVENPATGETVTFVAAAGPTDVDRAAWAAHAAFADGRWARRRGRDRAQVLQRAAVLLAEAADSYALDESIQTGRPLREMRAQVARAPEWFEYFASVAHTAEGVVPDFGSPHLNVVKRVPMGVVGLLTPWNHPLLILMKKLAAALAAGNSVVLKPSEFAPVSALRVARLLEEAGLPPGVLNVVPGYGSETGKALVDHPAIAKLDLTGGTETGRAVAAAAGRRLVPVAAELGGKAAVVVFEDTDPRVAAAGATFAAFVAAGQTCVQGSRLLVQESAYDAVVEEFLRRTAALRVGDPLGADTQVGPLASRQQLLHVSGAVEAARAEGVTVLHGGERLTEGPYARGYYYTPTVVADVDNDMAVWRNEIFGPVVVVKPFRDEEEAVALVNDAQFGLAASVWTRDLGRAHRVVDRLDVGIAWVNDHHRIDPSSPWSGRKDSGIGQENGIEGYKSYTVPKSIIINTADEHSDWFGSSLDARYS